MRLAASLEVAAAAEDFRLEAASSSSSLRRTGSEGEELACRRQLALVREFRKAHFHSQVLYCIFGL
jgi:hypothetical protein